MSTITSVDLDRAAVTTARTLAIDAVEAAGSGHPGTALALAPAAHLIFQRHLRHDPTMPLWSGRDRFVLSCGHASILLYTQLFLTGYDVTLEDLKAFRRLGSRTPGHPELGHTDGVEMTTGPLGQGLATAVGMAMALRRERDTYDPDAAPGRSPFDRTVWVLASDGDLQEGLSYEAGALAGHHRLGNLVVVFDDNRIQIEGGTDLSTSEDTAARFRAQGWTVDHVDLAPDGDIDVESLDRALTRATTNRERPSLIMLRSQIAWPAPNAVNTAASHGAPLGPREAAATKEVLGVDPTAFTVPDEVLDHTRKAVHRGTGLRADWERAVAAWEHSHPEAAAQRRRTVERALPADLAEALPRWDAGAKVSPRDASGATIQALAGLMPELWGGSADLGDSNRTTIKGGGSYGLSDTDGVGPLGRNVHWGVREHAMAAAMNGIALIGSSRFYAGTFLIFSDYQRPAIRLAARMGVPAVYVWSHDSVALGADGPTHQPIEHLASLRAMPGLAVVRPADAVETVAAWVATLTTNGPVGLVLARQATEVAPVPHDEVMAGVARGAYVVEGGDEPADVLLVATGSEVGLARAARATLGSEGVRARVVSMPSREWFEAQDAGYRTRVLPPDVTARVVVEAATSFGWRDIAGPHGEIVGIDGFGLSASAEDALEATGMTVDAVVAAARRSRRTARAAADATM